jgi:hypothetical protein
VYKIAGRKYSHRRGRLSAAPPDDEWLKKIPKIQAKSQLRAIYKESFMKNLNPKHYGAGLRRSAFVRFMF